MTPTDAALDVLAVMRLSRLVREDTILDRPRHWLIVHNRCKRWFPQFIKCPWCVSMWCGFIVAFGRRVCPRWWAPIGFSLAASYTAALAAIHVEPQPEPDDG